MTDRPPALEDVFRTLDRWRHLPAYRLEPNLAPFFGLFLHDILRETVCRTINKDSTVIPEFPLHFGTLDRARENAKRQKKNRENQSAKVDYSVFQNDSDTAYFVELKTDRDSFRPEQYCDLLAAKKAGLRALLCGVIEICKATNQKAKYVHLLYDMKNAGLIKICDNTLHGLHKLALGEKKGRWIAELKSITLARTEFREIEIVYITPSGVELKKQGYAKEGFREVGFGRVAKIARNRGGIGHVFADNLEKWKCATGSADPRTFRAVP